MKISLKTKTEPTILIYPRRCNNKKLFFCTHVQGIYFGHKLRIVCEQSWGEIQSRFSAELLPKNK